MKAPIVSDKHYIAYTNANLASGGIRLIELVNALARGAARATTQDVDEGSVIKAVYVEYWVNGRGASSTTQFTAILFKNPGGSNDPTYADTLNLQAYDNKKNIFYTTQGVLAQSGSQSVPIIRQWFKIPKGKQRFGRGDKLQLCLAATGQDITSCGICTYKEYV